MHIVNVFEKDTIVAPATPPGEGGIGIVRLSGLKAEEFLCDYFSPSSATGGLESNYLYHGFLKDHRGHVLDEVMAVIMRQPRSYTREDVCEIHCHGGGLIVRRVVDLFLRAGARMARPGEFTLRAFLNGRIDLTRAEAVIDLIRSRSELASNIAIKQLNGGLADKIAFLREKLILLLAEVEAAIDFSEEDIEIEGSCSLGKTAGQMMSEMDDLIQSFECGRIAKEGVNILILGRPNVGKSSLLNSLLGEARAIVTDIPGTTRDTIEEDLVLGGLPLRLVDTAGIRHTEDPVEAEGVRRARSKIEGADLVLLVVDGSMSLDNDDLLAIDACRHKDVLVVLNKADLGSLPFPDCLGQFPVVKISALQGLGLTDLVDKISQHFTFRPEVSEARETVILTEFRHKQALMAARDSLGRFRESLVQGMSPEFSAVEIGEALDRVGEITGETTPDDVLDRIFTKFCIGK